MIEGKTIGERIHNRRLALGMSVDDLARILGKNRTTIYRYENSAIAGLPSTVLNPLAKAIQTTPEELMAWEGPSKPDLLPVRTLHPIPVIGCVKAGWDSPAAEESIGTDCADVSSPNEYFFLRVKGDSMSPQINEGDLALVHKQPTAESGDLVVALVDGEMGTIKKYIRRGSTVILQPFNSNYEALVLTGNELSSLVIVGRVIETKRKW